MKAAFEEAKKAVDADPAGAQALASLGEVYEAMGLYEAALDAYHRAARQRSLASTEPLMYGALLATRMGRFGRSAKGLLNSLTRARRRESICRLRAGLRARTQEGLSGGGGETGRTSRRELRRIGPDRSSNWTSSTRDWGWFRPSKDDSIMPGRVLHKIGKPRVRMSDFVILLAAASNEPAMAIENLRLNPYYRNYRYLVTEQGLRPLYGDAGFQQLLSDTYPEWVKMLAEQSEILTVPPPVLPAPAGFLKSSGLETRATD